MNDPKRFSVWVSRETGRRYVVIDSSEDTVVFATQAGNLTVKKAHFRRHYVPSHDFDKGAFEELTGGRLKVGQVYRMPHDDFSQIEITDIYTVRGRKFFRARETHPDSHGAEIVDQVDNFDRWGLTQYTEQ